MTRHRVTAALLLGVVLPLMCGLSAAPQRRPDRPTHVVPYRMSETLHMIVRAKFNGKGPFNFIVDTGAPAMFVTKEVAKKVGVEPDRAGWATFDRMEIEGGATIENAKAVVQDIFQIRGMNALALPGVKLHGVLGYTVLARYRMDFDLSKTSMTWTELDFDPPLPRPLLGDDGEARGAPEELEFVGALAQAFGSFFNRGQSATAATRGFLGVELTESGKAVEVKAVLAESPAEAAGLKPRDRLVEFAGKAVRSATAVLEAAASIGVDEELRIVVDRNGEKMELTAKLGKGF